MNSEFDWYLFPNEVQRILPTVVQNAQKPVVIKCFGNVLCSREQFKMVGFVLRSLKCEFVYKVLMWLKFLFQVVKTIYSYFMTLREFYKWTRTELSNSLELFRTNGDLRCTIIWSIKLILIIFTRIKPALKAIIIHHLLLAVIYCAWIWRLNLFENLFYVYLVCTLVWCVHT